MVGDGTENGPETAMITAAILGPHAKARRRGDGANPRRVSAEKGGNTAVTTVDRTPRSPVVHGPGAELRARKSKPGEKPLHVRTSFSHPLAEPRSRRRRMR